MFYQTLKFKCDLNRSTYTYLILCIIINCFDVDRHLSAPFAGGVPICVLTLFHLCVYFDTRDQKAKNAYSDIYYNYHDVLFERKYVLTLDLCFNVCNKKKIM